ncbi:MAG: phosphoribosyltransferase family protein [Alphaproteobacteria bacterium]|nr:phosphoribosyltransferase family protein [Alphaproteobacteria bacterium]
MTRVFADRTEAGRLLARLIAERHFKDPVVLALPRGGVPIAAEVARVINAPMDLILVRKIGTPGQPELALGAVVDGETPHCVVNESVKEQAGVSDVELERAKQAQFAEIDRRRALYLRGRERVHIVGKTAIVVDDGVATGATARVALQALRSLRPAKLVLAVPVAPAETLKSLGDEVDELLCLQTPEPFYAVGTFYRDFDPVSDQDVASMVAELNG